MNVYADIPGCIVSTHAHTHTHTHTHTLEEKPSGTSVIASEIYVRFCDDDQSKATEFL